MEYPDDAGPSYQDRVIPFIYLTSLRPFTAYLNLKLQFTALYALWRTAVRTGSLRFTI